MSPHLDLTAPYAPLVRRIEAEGSVEGQILRIDHFLNHRIEPAFIFELAHELAKRLSAFQPNLILTAEASGIAPALIVAHTLNVPMIYAKKYSHQVEAPSLSRLIRSPTKGEDNRLVVSTRYLRPGQRVVIVDDFLANGAALTGLISLVEQAGATVVGAGIAIEKAFQPGGDLIRRRGYRVESLARIESMSDSGEIRFVS